MTYHQSPRLQTRTHWGDWVELVLAVWFFLSPWILNFGIAANATDVATAAAWNAWILGALVFIVSLATMNSPSPRGEGFNVFLGAWIFVAPWLFGFRVDVLPMAAWDHWITGAVIALVALFYSASNGSSDRQFPR
jgi:hypothetical protein